VSDATIVRSPEEIEANVAKLNAEAEKARQEARKASAEADEAELSRDRDAEKRRAELARNYNHLVYAFEGAVSGQSAKSCVDQLVHWHRTRPGEAIEIIFNSPGGSVVDGFALWDVLRDIRAKGHTITTVSYGMAASMAGILLQAGDVRVMGKESWLMLHEISFGASGKIGDIEDTVGWADKIQKRVADIFAERSTLTAKQILNRIKRKDLWLSSDEALKLGLIDGVR
jgi:ATP-dependent Clp endopeptidase proteolytic subunit ClpP